MADLLVCVDLSEHSVPVLRAAGELAALTGATLHVLHVAAGEPAFMGYDPPGGVHDREDHAIEVEHERVQLDVLISDAGLDDRAERLVVSGPITEAIIEVAGGVDASIVIVGRHGNGGILSRLIGSVAIDLVGRCPRPVLVVPVS